MENSSDKLNPMFNRKNFRKRTLPIPNNVRKTDVERKVRKDKKYDLKIPLNPSQERIFRRLAYERKMTRTSFASYLLIKGMDYNLDFEEVPYENYPTTVHAKIPIEQHERLFEFDLDWNYKSMRRSAHRILIGMLNFLNGEVVIK